MDKIKEVSASQMISKLKIILPYVFFTIIFSIITIIAVSNRADVYHMKFLELTEIQNQIVLKENNLVQKETEFNGNAIDLVRVNRDLKLAENLFSELITWDDFETYTKNRDKAINEYKLDPNTNGFMQIFLPEIKTNYDSNGKAYNTITYGDKNMTFNKFQGYLISSTPNENKYFGKLHWKALSPNKNYAYSYEIVRFKADKDGNIYDIDGFLMPPNVRE